LTSNLEDINCAICMMSFCKDPEEDSDKTGLLIRYMETPCKHYFHSNCLEKWMEEKLSCPCCRKTIPPY